MRLVCLAGFCLLFVATRASALPEFILFESGQVRPLALSTNGEYLYAVNTPDNRLEILKVGKNSLVSIASVPVGLEPVAVAARNNHEVWVVNHVSDSVSIVDVQSPFRPVVKRTLLVGDEPRDIVFAGPGKRRAFITTAHRGQNVPYDPQLMTPSIGRADVWVYDANALDDSLNGGPLTIITLFTDTPRALAVSKDGRTVYAAGFHTGNQTSIVSEFLRPPLPPPTTNFAGDPQPQTSLIVKHDGFHWVDELGRTWDDAIMLNLPDKDVFMIDAMANPPAIAPGPANSFSGVGTVLYNMAVNPVNGNVYVSNTEALNHIRFEGPGIFADSTVRAHHNENRITVLKGSEVLPRHLNKHLDFSTCCAPVPNAESVLSLALPMEMQVSSDGKTLYVVAMGSSKVGIYSTKELEEDTFFPNAADQVQVSGGGPTGLVLDHPRGQLYVMTRFDNGISIVDTGSRTEVAHVQLFNPEPQKIVKGRRFLYDATLSSKGDSSCASCHVFGDNDSLAWDLGDPDGPTTENNNPTKIDISLIPPLSGFPSMKGPLTTQTLRGMANHGPMHWRGDRTGSFTEPNIQPDSGAFNEREAFRQFQGGFVGLVGRDSELPAEDMEAFTDFILQLTFPPNPIRNLDDSLTPEQQVGRDFYMESPATLGFLTCNDCHVLDPLANAEYGVDFPGFFGTDGMQAGTVFEQMFKVPHLRNLYTKVGKFGMPELPPFPPLDRRPSELTGHLGDQIRGFGVSRAGDTDSVLSFLHAGVFSQSLPFPNPQGFPAHEEGEPLRRKVASFLFAFDTNLKPIVGQQMTLWPSASSAAEARVDLLVQRAEAGDCDLVAKAASLEGETRGYLYVGSGMFVTDRQLDAPVSLAGLRARAQEPWSPVTFTCVPPNSGYRIGIDRDNNGVLDGDEF